MKKITLKEEISKIKRLYNFKKGDTMLSEQTCKKDDLNNIPLCSELIKNSKDKTIRGPFTDSKFYTVTTAEGCPQKCVTTKEEQERFNRESKINPPHEDNIKNNFFDIDVKDGDANAGEIQKYLVGKGYLPRYRTENGEKKDNIDWNFADISAKAFGDFIKDKLGIDVGIQSLQDLQDYLDLLGFDTGSLGFGEKVYKGLVWLVKFIEKGATEILNDPKYNKIVKDIFNYFLKENLYDTQVADIDKTIEGKGLMKPDVWLSTSAFIRDVSISEINDKTVLVDGDTEGHLEFKVGNLPGDSWVYTHPQQYLKMHFDLELNYNFKVEGGKFCIMVELVSAYLKNKTDIDIKPILGKYFIDIINNKVNLHSGGECGKNNICRSKIKTLYTIPTKSKISKKICSKGYCLKIDDIIKLIRGQEDISNLPNLMVDMCPPPPESKDKKTTKTNEPHRHSGKSYDQLSREAGGGSFYHAGKI